MIESRLKTDVDKPELSIPDKRLVALQLPEPLRQRLRKEAYEKELSLSAMIREILERHYEDR